MDHKAECSGKVFEFEGIATSGACSHREFEQLVSATVSLKMIDGGQGNSRFVGSQRGCRYVSRVDCTVDAGRRGIGDVGVATVMLNGQAIPIDTDFVAIDPGAFIAIDHHLGTTVQWLGKDFNQAGLVVYLLTTGKEHRENDQRNKRNKIQ
ncbi:MAG: hypothetical protein ACSW8I_03060 [bacterium]